jgi:hypothetical protein
MEEAMISTAKVTATAGAGIAGLNRASTPLAADVAVPVFKTNRAGWAGACPIRPVLSTTVLIISRRGWLSSPSTVA